MELSFSLTEKQHLELMKHLFPSDGKEALSIILCGNSINKECHRFLLHKIYNIPYEDCSFRSDTMVKWPTSVLKSILEEAERKHLAVFKVHSHNKFYNKFSEIDDLSDKTLFPQIYTWIENSLFHGSIVLLSDGSLIGRVCFSDGSFLDIDRFNLIGSELRFMRNDKPLPVDLAEFALRLKQTFGEDTYNRLRKLKIAVIGCSGTGSFVIEHLARLGVGELILVDPDIIEIKNLNRIVNSTMQDALNETAKVTVFERSIKAIDAGTEVKPFQGNLCDTKIINAVKNADIIFGCMDSIDGRHLLNRLSNFYLLPYFDLGVKLIADGKGGIDSIAGTVHYLQPGRSTLLSRGSYTLKKLESANLLRSDPEEYGKRKKSGYIEGTDVDKPAVISVNSLISSIAINDLLARIHNYRYEDNCKYASTTFNFCDWSLITESEEKINQDNIFIKYLGRGDISPILDMSSLS